MQAHDCAGTYAISNVLLVGLIFCDRIREPFVCATTIVFGMCKAGTYMKSFVSS